MPRKRQIPFLHVRTLADGSRKFDWKPSNALRDAGWPHVTLGTDEADAVRRALEINRQIAAWRAGAAAPATPGERESAPRLVRWDGLIARYRKSRDWLDLAPKTQEVYNSRIRLLTTWANDGQLIVRQIDYAMVQDFKRALEQAGSSDYRTQGLMITLRLLLSFAEREGVIPRGTNPARGAKVRQPKARGHIVSLQAVEAMVAQAEADGHPNLALAILLGFWTIQRESDVLGRFNRMAWRQLHDVEARDAALLKGSGGKVMGFRFQQGKTGAWVDCPAPPFLHAAIEAAWQAGNLPGDVLLADDLQPGHALGDWRLQRQWRDLRTRCAAAAREQGKLLLAAEIAGSQFRDLRRSGQVYMRNAGAKKEWITSLSGHTILLKRSIMDTYMPPDTPAACAAVACALRLRNRQMKEKTG